MPTNRLQALQNKKAEQVKAMREMISKAGDNEFTADEQTAYDSLKAEVEKLVGEISREQGLLALESTTTEVIPDDNVITSKASGGEAAVLKDPKRGFESYGDFCIAIFKAGQPNAVADKRLLVGAAPTTYGGEGSVEDGAFMVPPEFSNEIRTLALGEDAILPMTDSDPISGNSMTYPADETTPWGTDGIRAYWEAEAAQATQTKPKGKTRTLRLRKLFALVPVTDELTADSPALSSYLTRKTGESILFKTNDSFFVGGGAGMPLGIKNAAALVTVAKETSQTADTIVAENLSKMYARQLNPTRAVWHLNPDAFPQLPSLTIANQPVWVMPGRGFADAPGGLLLGRPVFFNESCETIGDAGDVYFADWKGYKTITKQGGIQFAVSIHLWFDYDMQAFRAIFRVDGQPSLQAAVSPKNGSNTRSHFVTLAARA